MYETLGKIGDSIDSPCQLVGRIFFHQNHKAGVLPLTGIGGAKAREEPPSEALLQSLSMIKMASDHQNSS